jgi:hypothetical protein
MKSIKSNFIRDIFYAYGIGYKSSVKIWDSMWFDAQSIKMKDIA